MRIPQPPMLVSGITILAVALIFNCYAVPGNLGSTAAPIPWSELGAGTEAQYSDDRLSIVRHESGARLVCVFQKLEGDATPEGLWLTSTLAETPKDRFRIMAESVGRAVRLADSRTNSESTRSRIQKLREEKTGDTSSYDLPLTDVHCDTLPTEALRLPVAGTVQTSDKVVRFARTGLVEEYSVSMDGVRQDFVIAERPAGGGDLRVDLGLSGVWAETAPYGARLTLPHSGRVLAYSRLRATDATGRELAAHLEVLSPDRVTVRVGDAHATYPVRIDPTFSDADWVSLNPGIPGARDEVRAIAVDGSGNVYVGGYFGIAKWNGSAWSALGSGVNGDVHALAVSGTNLYAGGDFTVAGGVTVNYIAKWDGNAWSALGSGMNGEIDEFGYKYATVYALAVSGANLYAGGEFTTAGGVTAKGLARWNGSSWSALGAGVNGDVLALAVSGSILYAGGWFTTAGGVAVNKIAKWNGNAWSALGTGMNSGVKALAVSGTNLYAGGYFSTAGGVAAYYIAKWNGSAWSALGSGMDSSYGSVDVHVLAVSGTNLYAGGEFVKAGGITVNYIARWDGSAWSDVGGGMDLYGYVFALAVSGTNLYAGGRFVEVGGVTVNYIGRWEGSAWSALGSGMDGSVSALAVSGTNLYAGGEFRRAVDVTANNIARWDGRAWSALGSGMNGYVDALVVSGTDVYAGWTSRFGGLGAVEKWDGRTWSLLGSMDGSVLAMAVSGADLYAAGGFTRAGGVPAGGVAKGNGNAWSALGSGMNGAVKTLAVIGTNLYAGGYFTAAGGGSANRIARWDGTSWWPLGSGVSGGGDFIGPNVSAFAVSGTDLYAGGDFIQAGGVTVNNIAKWNGSVWSALGSGIRGGVRALAVIGTDLYAGGSFTNAGGVTANCIARWDGSAWSALGSGTDGLVSALAADESGHLFLGGYFFLAGTNVSPFIAQANVGGAGVTGGWFGTLVYSPSTGFSCSFSGATLGQPYRIQTSPSLAAPSWNNLTNFIYTGPTVIRDTSAAFAPNKFFRAVTP